MGSFKLNGAASPGASWSDMVKLTDQKFTSHIQANAGLESFATTVSAKNLPNSNIIAFEYKSVVPSNLTGSESAGGMFVNAISEGSKINGLLVAVYSTKDGVKLVLVGMGEPTPLYQTFEDLSGDENRIGIYVNKQTKQIGYIVNGEDKGYKWSFPSSFNNMHFSLGSGFDQISNNSTNLGREVTFELITDHTKLKYKYPSGATDICGTSI